MVSKGKIIYEKCLKIFFTSDRFPSFEVLHGEDQKISSSDHMYIYSLLLYYSCVLKVNEFFQKSCEALDMKHQPIVVKFFHQLNQTPESSLTRDCIRSAITKAVPSPLHLKIISSSPRATPDKYRPTPKKDPLSSKEYQRAKTQLENERYERQLLESELKQAEEKIKKLGKKRQTAEC
jgi:hypothetical protein